MPGQRELLSTRTPVRWRIEDREQLIRERARLDRAGRTRGGQPKAVHQAHRLVLQFEVDRRFLRKILRGP